MNSNAPMDGYVLHAIAIGASTYALSDKQRQWCISEIVNTEGYTESDAVNLNDRDLCTLVLHCYKEYCQDKGLL